MALITSYSTLLTEIGTVLARSDLSSDTPGFVQRFEERFFRQPKNYGPWMEAAYSTAMSSGVSAVPAGFIGWKVVYISMSPTRRLRFVSLAELYEEYPRSGCRSVPYVIARNGSNFEYGPFPSSDFTVGGSYYAKPTVLRSYSTGGADAAAHYLIVNAPDLLLYGALLESAPHLRQDDRLVTWQGFYDRALAEYRDLQKQQNMSGGPMQVRVA
jgi:hypothetical protein